MSVLFPELLLLLVPLALLVFWRGRTSPLGDAARAAILVLLVLLAAVPLARIGDRGVDVVIVADVSRSMPQDTRARTLEIIRLLEEARGTGDRVGVVLFGRQARVEKLPQAFGTTDVFIQQVDPDGSDLGGAVTLAASLIPPERPGRIIVLSDGEATGSSVTVAAHEAATRGIPVDIRAATRPGSADIAVESLDLPGRVDEREPFQFSAWVRSDRSLEGDAVLLRDGVEIARRREQFRAGPTQLTFRDVIERPGLSRYQLRIDAAADRVPENNRGEGAVRIEAPATILLVNSTGAPDNLSRALASGRMRLRITTPAQMPRELADLQAFRAVIVENVPAGELGTHGLTNLTRYANELGGGLLFTGGRAAFGVGGYFRSDIDPYLPVSMEIKNEHRKLSLAMTVVLDRSGSMLMPVPDGRTKMDLANLGTCAAIDTLGPLDEVAVVAVDSAPHVVTPLSPADDKDGICRSVRGIQAGGGGIFTYTALVTAANLVQESDKGTRHIVLFADAADAEEPGEYVRLLERLRSIGVSVSVIGLGEETDVDGAFLKDVAERGGGRALFTTDVEELPRLFAQEAITVARSSFITDRTATRALADMVLLGELPASAFPAIDGYNLSYLRPGATLGAVTTDDYQAPVFAFWHRGLGRVAALTAEVDGEFSAGLSGWRDFGAFTVGVGRWLLGGDPPIGMQATLDRRGAEAIVRVELDPDRARDAAEETRSASASVVPPGQDATPQRLDLAWIDADTLEARFPLHRAGHYLGAVRLPSGDVLTLPPLSLPYSPEFEPRADPEEGRRTLAELARVTGGAERTTWDDVFNPSRLRDRRIRDLVMPLTALLLVLHVGEIAGRRLLWFVAARAWWRERRPAFAWRGLRLPARTATGTGRGVPAPSSGPEPDARPVSAPEGVAAGADGVKPAGSPAAPASAPAASALARAKAKARTRLGD
jgi:Mg-chelatase subunit ChlD